MADPNATSSALRLDTVEKANIRGEKTRIRTMGPDEAPPFYTCARPSREGL